MNPSVLLQLPPASGKSFQLGSIPPEIQPEVYQRSYRKGRTRGAPVCRSCRVTLSQGDCLNRMCKRFIGRAA